jgi:hypothetical protein
MVVVVLAGGASPALAQLVQGPISTGGIFGGRRPVNPNRTSQTLEMNLDVSGGYDQDPNAALVDPLTGSPGTETGWSVGQALLTSSYRIGTIRRSIAARARGNVNYQGNTRTPLTGGGSSLTGAMRFGRRGLNQWLVSADASYEPGWVFGAVNPALPTPGEVAPIDLVPEIGVIEQRWFTTSATSGYQHSWGARHQSDLQLGAGRVRPVGSSGVDNDWQNAMLTQSWAVTSSVGLTGMYRYDSSQQLDLAAGQEDPAAQLAPVRYQSGTVGVRLERRLPGARRMTLTLAGGATQLLPESGAAAAADVYHPSYSVSIDLVPARSWSFSVAANRSVTVLAGISSVPMENNNVSTALSGGFGRRLRLALSGSFMEGTSITGNGSSVTTAIGGNFSMRYGVSRTFGTFVTYSYYHHELEVGLPTAAGLPPLYDRQSVRAGFTLWVPLYGTF